VPSRTRREQRSGLTRGDPIGGASVSSEAKMGEGGAVEVLNIPDRLKLAAMALS
jgi:hypothetical protein